MSQLSPLPLEEFRDQLNRQLDTVLAQRMATAARIDPLFGELTATFGEYMGRTGKRLRPYLMYLAYLGYGGDQPDAIIRASLSQELYHNAWLIHDDIIDRDMVRHGGPNVAGTYRAKLKSRRIADADHLASTAALLAGDLSLALATELILDSPFPAEHTRAAALRMQQVSFTEMGGEMIDVFLTTVPLTQISPERLLTMYRYKTAAYSFELPLATGATLAGAPAAEISALTELATPWGIAFQLTDDLLGTFASENQLGKPVLSDLREGKRTVLYLLGLQMADPASRRRLKTLAGNPKAGYRHLAEMRRLLDDSGAHARTEQMAQTQAATAIAGLDRLKIRPDVADILHQLAEYTIRRQH